VQRDDESRVLGQGVHQLVEVNLDFERWKGFWVHVIALIGDPDPDVGHMRPIVRHLVAVAEGGELVALTTEEVNRLADRFERAYNNWRGKNGRHKAGP
jgi:hypothetical protein